MNDVEGRAHGFFKIPTQHFDGCTDKNHEKLTRKQASWLRFKPRPPEYR